ncbi:MAG: hypothetical protein R3F43_32480 [bacterium]
MARASPSWWRRCEERGGRPRPALRLERAPAAVELSPRPVFEFHDETLRDGIQGPSIVDPRPSRTRSASSS